VYFLELHLKLVELARDRVHAGELTERGLSRLCGVSQPHMHNVLKNIRALSTDSADRLMRALNIQVPDLLWRVSGEGDASVRAVPMARHRIGPGMHSVLSEVRGHLPVPRWLVEDLIDPLAARLAPDLLLPRALEANDLVLLDQNPADRRNPGGDSAWVLAEGGGFRVRYLRMGGTRLYVANEITLDDPQNWQSIPLRGRNILDIVRGRIVWTCREMEETQTGSFRPAC